MSNYDPKRDREQQSFEKFHKKKKDKGRFKNPKGKKWKDFNREDSENNDGYYKEKF